MPHPFYDKVIRSLEDCAVECSMCAISCLQEREVARMRDCILLDLDCADLCRTLIGMLGRTSEYSRELLVICAKLCDQCADVCEKYKDMEHCVRCAKVCRECGTVCNNFAQS